MRVDWIGVNLVCFANECARVKRHTGALRHASVVPTIGATRRACNVTPRFLAGFPIYRYALRFSNRSKFNPKNETIFFFVFHFSIFLPLVGGKYPSGTGRGAWTYSFRFKTGAQQ